mgnify:CR=1 FL=1
MSAPFRILAIPGSLRRGSVNRALLEAARDEAPDAVEVALWGGLGDVPLYNEDIDTAQPPAAVAELRRLIGEADAVLVSTPEYNSSLPGGLKNALDWASRPYGVSALVAKPVAVIGASPSSFGAAWAQAEGRKVIAASGGRVLEDGLSFSKAKDRIGEDGRVKADDPVRAELGALLTKLVELARTPLDDDEAA